MTLRVPRPLWLTVVATLLLLLGAAGYTGSSALIPVQTCPLLSPTERSHGEVFGRSRAIRSDEWSVEVPLEREQQLTSPSFPEVNLDQGLGQLQRNSYPIPILEWGMVFRPLLWPLFTGTRWGFGPRWFLRNLLVLTGVFAWFRTITARRGSARARERLCVHVAALGAVAVLFSSAVSWWMSTPLTEMLGFSGLGVAIARNSMVEQRPRHRAVGWLIAYYFLTCAFFQFYPPIWAPMLWLICATLIDCGWREHHGSWRTVTGALPGLSAVVLATATGIAYYAPYLVNVMHTAYPGERRAVAGGFALARLLTLAWPSLGIIAPHNGGERYLGPEPSNVCEYSAVEAIPLFALLTAAVVRGRVRLAASRALRGSPALTVAWIVLALWQFVPLPELFGELALLEWSPVHRSWFVFGVACALVTMTILGELPVTAAKTVAMGWRGTARGALIATLVSLALYFPVHNHYSTLLGPGWGFRLWGPMLAAALLTLLGVSLVGYRIGPLLMALGWALPLVITNFAVNPLVKTQDLVTVGKGHEAIRKLLEKKPGRVIDYGTHFGAELSGEGVPTLGGVQMAPDLDLFHFLEPESPGLTRDMVNRYTYIHFVSPPQVSHLQQADLASIAISPCSARLATLGVNHFLVARYGLPPPECANAFEVQDVGDGRIWSRRIAVGLVGVATTTKLDSALRFDFAPPNSVKLQRQRHGLSIEAPAGYRPFATAVNLSLVDSVSCRGATASTLDAHLVFKPAGKELVRCEVKFLGTWGALARLAGLRKPWGISQEIAPTLEK